MDVKADVEPICGCCENSNENENGKENEVDGDTYAGALCAPRAGSPAFVSLFVFVLIFGVSNLDFRNDHFFRRQ